MIGAYTRRGKMYGKEIRLNRTGKKLPVKFAILGNGKVCMSGTK